MEQRPLSLHLFSRNRGCRFTRFGTKSDGAAAQTALDDAIHTNEGPSANEQDLGGVDPDVFLLRMFAATLRGNVAHRALKNLEKSLLNPLARNVTCDGDVLGLARNLVDLVDVDDAHLGPTDIEFCSLEQSQDDVLNILSDITGFCDDRGIGDGEGNIEHLGQSLGQEGLATAGRSEEQDVALLDLHRIRVVDGRREGFATRRRSIGCQNPLVMVVNRDAEGALGSVLTDDMLVQLALDLRRFWNAKGGCRRLIVLGTGLLLEHPAANTHTGVTNVHARSRYQPFHLGLRLAAETAHRDLGCARHGCRRIDPGPFLPMGKQGAFPCQTQLLMRSQTPLPQISWTQIPWPDSGSRDDQDLVSVGINAGTSLRLETTSSTRPNSRASSADMKLSRSQARSTTS